VALAHDWPENSVIESFASNDLQRICRAVDTAVAQSGCIAEIARAADRDRTTLYRAFRMEKGPNLDTMLKVLRALGLQVVVEPRNDNLRGVGDRRERERFSNKDRNIIATARRFTEALKAGTQEALFDVFMAAMRKQRSVAEFARKTKVSRENLYRVFARNPRLGTFLDVLNALELQFAVRPVAARALRPAPGRAQGAFEQLPALPVPSGGDFLPIAGKSSLDYMSK